MPFDSERFSGLRRAERTGTFVALAAAILLSVEVVSVAAPPTIRRLQPIGFRLGEATDLVVHGDEVTEGAALWVSIPSDIQRLADKPAGHFQLLSSTDAPLGIHGLRVATVGGVSRLALFVIDDLPSVAGQTENTKPESAQVVTPLVAIDGAVVSLQRHYFRFAVVSGQTVSFEVLARRIGSRLDPSLFLYAEDGREIAYTDDTAGLSGDCQLSHTFVDAGSYMIELRDVRYEGGDTHFYRLRIGDFPLLNGPYPMAVRRGARTRVDFAGLTTEAADPAWADVPGDWPHDWFPVSTRIHDGKSSGFTTIAVSDLPEFLEREPNDTTAQANQVELGMPINARFDDSGDVDRFTFSAKKGDRFVFSGVTRGRGSPTDLILKLTDADGQQLKKVDDSGTDEGTFDYTFKSDGEYTLTAEDLHGRGGTPFTYRIETTRWNVGFTLSADSDVINVPAGGVGTLPVKVSRRGHNGPITIAATDLPKGWSSLPTTLGAGMNTGVLTVRGPETSGEARVLPIRVVGSTQIGDVTVTQRADVSTSLRSHWGGTAMIPPSLRESFATAVVPKQPLLLRLEPSEVVLGMNLKTTIKVIADRGAGLDETIALATSITKNALPKDVTLSLKPIPKGQSEIELELIAGAKAPGGPFVVVINGTHTKDKQTVTVTSPPLAFTVDHTLLLQVPTGDRHLKQGDQLIVTVTINRDSALVGGLTTSLSALPPGVTASTTTITADESTAAITLTVASDAPAGSADVVVEVMSTEVGKLNLSQPLGKITVD